jgi:hypothetical protein
MMVKREWSGAFLALALGATAAMAQATAPAQPRPEATSDELAGSVDAAPKGFAATPVEPYPTSNWTLYSFKDGRDVRYDGQVDDATGFVKGVTLDYGGGQQIRVSRPAINPRDITMVKTQQTTILARDGAEDLATILEDSGEQIRTRQDLEKYVGGEIAARAVTSMKELAIDLRRLVTPSPSVALQPFVPQPGMPVFCAGNKIGTVESVGAARNGELKVLSVMMETSLGFGGKLVAIPASKFRVVGDIVQVDMTTDELVKLSHERP